MYQNKEISLDEFINKFLYLISLIDRISDSRNLKIEMLKKRAKEFIKEFCKCNEEEVINNIESKKL